MLQSARREDRGLKTPATQKSCSLESLGLEGLRRQPWRGSAATQVWALARVVQLSKAWPAESRRVDSVVRGVWPASRLVEYVNSVARMQQARHRRMTQGLRDLKRLYWNLRRFRTGRREHQTPSNLRGLKLADLKFRRVPQADPTGLRNQLPNQLVTP